MSTPTFTDAASRELDRRPSDPRDFVRQMDDDKLGCRTQGHRFPKLRPGKAPKGVRIVRFRDGTYQMTYHCPDCGTEKTRLRLPEGYQMGTSNSYRYPRGYTSPPGSGLTRADYMTEDDRRIFSAIDGTGAVDSADRVAAPGDDSR